VKYIGKEPKIDKTSQKSTVITKPSLVLRSSLEFEQET